MLMQQKLIGLVFLIIGIALIAISGDGTASVYALFPMGLYCLFSKHDIFED